MELKKRSGKGANLMTLGIHQPIFSPSTSADSTPRTRSRPKSLFFRSETISPTCSEPTSPKVNCAGRVKDRAAMKPSTDGKGEKKSTLVRSLTNSLRGSLLVDSAIRCCRSPRDSVSGESDEEEEGSGNLARWFMTAELAGKETVEVEEGLVLAPLNALQMTKQRSTRVGEVALKI